MGLCREARETAERPGGRGLGERRILLHGLTRGALDANEARSDEITFATAKVHSVAGLWGEVHGEYTAVADVAQGAHEAAADCWMFGVPVSVTEIANADAEAGTNVVLGVARDEDFVNPSVVTVEAHWVNRLRPIDPFARRAGARLVLGVGAPK